jgi:dTDP-4-amino-4,6-dideoxygalactose transaminase
VIEDCAQSHGAMIGDRMAGSFGHASAFSFCQDKIMTTGGEGGFTIFKDSELPGNGRGHSRITARTGRASTRHRRSPAFAGCTTALAPTGE